MSGKTSVTGDSAPRSGSLRDGIQSARGIAALTEAGAILPERPFAPDQIQQAVFGNVIHTAPSHAMLADGLAQFLMWKRWPRWFLVHGSHPEDLALAEAWRRAATKFGAQIVEEREFTDTGGARSTDSGHVQVQAQLPVFTQRVPDYDIMITADENGVFAGYMPYHTWDARPVTGSAGLVPESWHPAQEAWGGTQFQSRFEKLSARPARPEEITRFRRLVGPLGRTPGGRVFWSDLSRVRDLRFDDARPIHLGPMTRERRVSPRRRCPGGTSRSTGSRGGATR